MKKKIRNCTIDELIQLCGDKEFIIRSHQTRGRRWLSLYIDGDTEDAKEVDLNSVVNIGKKKKPPKLNHKILIESQRFNVGPPPEFEYQCKPIRRVFDHLNGINYDVVSIKDSERMIIKINKNDLSEVCRRVSKYFTVEDYVWG